MDGKSNALHEFLNAVAPHLSGDVRKGIESLQKMLALFPSQAPAEIEKAVQALLVTASTSIQAMLDRARNLIQLPFPENAKPDSVEAFLKDASKLTPADLKALADGIALPVPKTRKAIIAELKQWLDSKGTYRPKSPLDKKRERAEMLLGDLPRKMGQMTGALADEIIRRATAASKDKELGVDGFVIYASILLGTPMKGPKTTLLKAIKSFVDRLAVSNSQTSGF